MEIEFTVDGERLRCLEGLTLAAALLLRGRRTLRRAADGSPRGLYCGMGVCHECAVEVDGRPGVRACVTAARAGMAVVTAEAPPRLPPAGPGPAGR